MKNKKKTKTSDASKIHLLESDVFGNAKSSFVLEICYLPTEKCFFQKSQIGWEKIQKMIKSILKMTGLLLNFIQV